MQWPHERSLVAEMQSRPFALLGVNTNGYGPAQLKADMAKEHLTWRSFADPPLAGRGHIATSWNVTSIPTLYLIDHRGVIRRKWIGAPDSARLEAAIGALVGEAEQDRAK